MGRYAANTVVGVDRSKAELEKILLRYNATTFISGWDSERCAAKVGFKIGGISVSMILPLPSIKDFRKTPTGLIRSQEAANSEWVKAQRQRWRALCLVVKAKLEAVDSGISTMEREFLADILLKSGGTVSEVLIPKLMPQLGGLNLLPEGGGS